MVLCSVCFVRHQVCLPKPGEASYCPVITHTHTHTHITGEPPRSYLMPPSSESTLAISDKVDTASRGAPGHPFRTCSKALQLAPRARRRWPLAARLAQIDSPAQTRHNIM